MFCRKPTASDGVLKEHTVGRAAVTSREVSHPITPPARDTVNKAFHVLTPSGVIMTPHFTVSPQRLYLASQVKTETHSNLARK
jgi:hypothetical protein